MLKRDLLQLIYDAVEVEGEKQETVCELSMRSGVIRITDEKGQEWEVAVRRLSTRNGG